MSQKIKLSHPGWYSSVGWSFIHTLKGGGFDSWSIKRKSLFKKIKPSCILSQEVLEVGPQENER